MIQDKNIKSKNKPKLHVICPFHTENNSEYSHCAFTGKGERFIPMMVNEGWEVIEYSNGFSESEKYATKREQILTTEELNIARNIQANKTQKDGTFHGDFAVIGEEIHKNFSERLEVAIKRNWETLDIVCHIFGHPHADLSSKLEKGIHVETGIGYPQTWSQYRVFESQAWRHYHAGKDKRGGTNYEWVVPNYYKSTDWPLNENPEGYLLFAGRICDVKGIATIVEIAKATGREIVLAGQGDISQWAKSLPESQQGLLRMAGHVKGAERAKLYGNASAIITPTLFVEPFCGVAVEAMLCGTPVIATSYGAFTETIEHGKTGYRCRTLGDFVEAVKRIPTLDRKYISERAHRLYTLEPCGKKYTAIFEQVYDLHNGGGWYTCEHKLDIID
jgi:glycosyltransferase involved in cell wall biosynthesis